MLKLTQLLWLWAFISTTPIMTAKLIAAELDSATHLDNGVVILLYQNVSDSTPKSTSVSPEVFAQHMQYLKQHHRVLPLEQMVSRIKAGLSLPDKAVAITFDDGHDNLYGNAHPILHSLDLPYTVFITPSTTGKNKQLTWAQIKEMAQQDASFANHSQTHSHYLQRQPDESQAQWLKRISDDITGAEAAIKQQLGYSLKYLAYPYGEFDLILKQQVEALGYTGFGQHSGGIYSGSDFSALPRFPAAGPYSRLSSLKVKLNSLAMPVTHSSVTTPLLKADEQNPHWTFTVVTSDISLPRMGCFFAGKSLSLTLDDNKVSPILPDPIPSGRSRVNCTVPSQAMKGRYYWYSQPWFRENKNGIWRY